VVEIAAFPRTALLPDNPALTRDLFTLVVLIFVDHDSTMVVLLTTKEGVFQWNPKELITRKKFTKSGDDEILSSALRPDGTRRDALIVGAEIAVSEKRGITLFSLVNDTQRKLKGVKVAHHTGD
jgi:hypothetical protein